MKSTTYTCDFCGINQNDPDCKVMVASQHPRGAAICDECTRAAMRVVVERTGNPSPAAPASDGRGCFPM